MRTQTAVAAYFSRPKQTAAVTTYFLINPLPANHDNSRF